MARNKEVTVLLLDKGPKMQSCISEAGRALSSFIFSKILHKPAHEVAIFFYGADETDNPLHEEFKNQGDASQYLHIVEAAPLKPPTVATLKDLNDIGYEQGKSDFLDALAIAMDTLYKAIGERPDLEKATVSKRIIMISNFLDPAQEDEDNAFATQIMQKLAEAHIDLAVYSIDDTTVEAPEAQMESKRRNLESLDYILKGLKTQRTSLKSNAEVMGMFSLKPVSSTAYYSGPLTFGDLLSINVKVTKKTSTERLPTMERFSDMSADDNAKHTVTYSRIFTKDAEEAEQEYAPEDMGKAYKYGSQVVPLPREQEQALSYEPDKGFSIVGMVSRDSVPRHYLTQDCWIVAPEKDNEGAVSAISALWHALSSQEAALLARFVPRLKGEITLGFLTPMSASDTCPQCLLMNCLPYEADVRTASFTSFQKKPELLPSDEQMEAVSNLIDNFSLMEGDVELHRPEATANPALHNFIKAMTDLALGTSSSVGTDDPLIDLILEPSNLEKEGKRNALEALSNNFSVQEKEKRKGRRREPDEQGTNGKDDNDPLEDFEHLYEAGKHDEALSTLRGKLSGLMEAKSRIIIKALFRLRWAAEKSGKSDQFNDAFQELHEKYSSSQEHADIWKEVEGQHIQKLAVT